MQKTEPEKFMQVYLLNVLHVVVAILKKIENATKSLKFQNKNTKALQKLA
jgi:hypothetical protein